MQTTTLGRTGLAVSRIAFGTWQLGGDWGRFDQAAAVAAIRRARELGVNFFDTAQAYGFGASERLLGTALRDELTHHRDQLVIATKDPHGRGGPPAGPMKVGAPPVSRTPAAPQAPTYVSGGLRRTDDG